MKLRTILSQHALETLRTMAEGANSKTDYKSNKTVLIDLLCRDLPAEANLQARLKAQPETLHTLVVNLAAEGGEVLESEAIEELSDGFVHRFGAQIDALTQAGLVFRDDRTLGTEYPLVGIPDALLKSIPIPTDKQGRLRQVMKAMSISLLRAFAQEIDLTLSDTRRPFLIQAIRKTLLDPKSVKAYLGNLTEDKRAILDLFLSQKSTTRDAVRNTLGEHTDRELEDLLWKTPFFYINGRDPKRPDTEIFLASDLRRTLDKVANAQGGQLESQLDDVLQSPPTPPTKIHDNAPYILHDVATLLGLVERKWPRRLKRGGIPKNDLKETTRFCQGESDPGYVEFLTLFVETAGLVQPQGGIWRVASDAGARLEQIVDIRQTLFAFWHKTDRWNEWSSDRTTAASRSTRMIELKRIRDEIIRGLISCKTDTWITYPSFYNYLSRLSDSFRHLAETPGSGRNLAAGGTTADELLRRVISGALHWMGVVRVGNLPAFAHPLHRSDQAAFQITKAGMTLMQNGDTDVLTTDMHPQNPNAKFVVQPTFEILAPPDLCHAHFLHLCGLTDLISQDVMTTFRLTQESLQQALNRGITGNEIRTFLQTHSATGVPEMVEGLIAECEGKYGEIELAPTVGILSVASETLLDELFAQKRIAAGLGKRLAPTAAALKETTRLEAFVQTLQQQGYMPSVSHSKTSLHEDRHQLVLGTTELSDLVAFLETASDVIEEKTGEQLEQLGHLRQRLKRALRLMPDAPRIKASKRYRDVLERAMQQKSPREEGLENLLRYDGPNPTSKASEIRELINYAIDHHLRIEIQYDQADEMPNRLIEPFSEDYTMIYAYCTTRKGDRVFRLDRIASARLTGERFERVT